MRARSSGARSAAAGGARSPTPPPPLSRAGKFLEPPPDVVALTGGTSARDDALRLSAGSAHIVVATTGRILDLVKRGACTLKNCAFVVMVGPLADGGARGTAGCGAAPARPVSHPPPPHPPPPPRTRRTSC